MQDDTRIAAQERLQTIREMRRSRPFTLAATVLITTFIALILDQASGAHIVTRILVPNEHPPDWRDLVQFSALLLGLPAAFLLWLWRDLNVRHDLDNHRRDTIVREFTDVQLRAAGAVQGIPQSAREALQVGTLHQLRSYMLGERGEIFRRPAFELFLALLSLPKIDHDLPADLNESALGPIIFECLRDILYEDWPLFFRQKSRLVRKSFREIRLPPDANLSGLFFHRCDFTGSELAGVDFSNTSFLFCNLSNAKASGCKMRGASVTEGSLSGIDLVGADMNAAILRNCECKKANLTYADLQNAQIIRSDLSNSSAVEAKMEHALFGGCNIASANFANATYNEATQFWNDSFVSRKKEDGEFAWNSLIDYYRNLQREPFRRAGARRRDEVPA